MSMTVSGFDPQGPFGIMLPKPVGDRIRQNDTRRFKNWRPMPFRQRGNLQMLWAIFAEDAGGASVVLTNKTYSKTTSATLCTNGPAFDKDGTLHEVGPLSTDRTAESGEWWSAEPDTDIGASYDVRTNGGSGGWGIAAAADTTWIQINAERVWRVTCAAKASPCTNNASSLFEIRATGSGGALDSATISASANN